MSFGSKRWVNANERIAYEKSWRGRYAAKMHRNSFLYFGLPFFTMMLAGTYIMTQFATVRYEQNDRHNQEVEDAKAWEGVRKRKVDMREEYYRLQKLDLDNWEPKRVKRLPGESENKW